MRNIYFQRCDWKCVFVRSHTQSKNQISAALSAVAVEPCNRLEKIYLEREYIHNILWWSWDVMFMGTSKATSRIKIEFLHQFGSLIKGIKYEI